MKQDELITVGDLLAVKQELLEAIRKEIADARKPQKEWLNTKEVMELFGGCPNTIGKLRRVGIRPAKLTGRNLYYLPQIEKILKDQVGWKEKKN